MLPSFLVIGAMRSGTTTLFGQICDHPDVVPPLQKEPHYFTSRYDYPWSWYRAQFPRSGVSGEASATMLFRPESPARVEADLGTDLPVIAILRDPVERAFSHYRMLRNHGRTPPPLSRLVAMRDNLVWRLNRILPVGSYEEQLPIWRDQFGKRLLVILHEDYLDDPQAVMNRVYGHIGLAPHEIDPAKRSVGTDRALSSPEEEDVRGALVDHYTPTRAYVSEMLGRPVPWQPG